MTTSMSKAPACVGCGAPAPAVMAPTQYVCTFCHRSQVLLPYSGPTRPPQPGPFGGPFPPGGAPPFGGPIHIQVAGPAVSGAGGPVGLRIALGLLPVVIMAVVGIAVAVSRGGSLGGPDPHGTSVGAGGVVPPGERMQWDSWSAGNVRVIGDINGDGVEDFVGRYKVLDMGTSKQTVFVGAFDGKTFKRIWASAPLGDSAQAGTSTVFGVAANQVLVTDFRAQAHTLDARTGKELRVTALSDKAQFACSPLDGRSEVWVDVADGKHVLFDLAKATATVAKKPAWCAARQAAWCADHAFADEPCEPSSEERSTLYSLGISARVMIRTDGRTVVIGTKTPGTAVPLIAGFDPKSRAITWQQTVAPDMASGDTMMDYPATLVNGRIYTIYKLTSPKDVHVTAFEVASGKRVMDFKVPRGDQGTEPREVVVSGQRIYVPHWTWLDVFDARDGHHLETVGMW